jgi:hypothetical protein
LLHSVPRQELGMEPLGESEFGLFEWRRGAFSVAKCKGQERRAVVGGWVYIGLSKESSHWAHIQNPDNVCGFRTKSDRVGHSLARGFCEVFLNSRLTQVGPDNVRLGVFVLYGFGNNLELLDSIIFTLSNMLLVIVRCSYTQEI